MVQKSARLRSLSPVEYARVIDRDELGLVIQHGTNLGSGDLSVYCLTLYFESTGEVAFYDSRRVTLLRGQESQTRDAHDS